MQRRERDKVVGGNLGIFENYCIVLIQSLMVETTPPAPCSLLPAPYSLTKS
ncbi:MAG: hypothetical protein F6K50_24570 [Moorea sp. SIO3I7]|uniref:hypothetical protein n=1 Tax=Moorena sp. SIO3I8 TaxID=2607833 RepID=UPI0013C082D5|nr:hypothetical protein [Moorena sp. SIO3I8]NEN98568.1 hypothetical protein [Moorena sp. SIO3I7]NEO04221.1 hypothetical protein [Moorena sp. SIO3I8]